MLVPLLLLGCPWIPCDQTLFADADRDGSGDANVSQITCASAEWVESYDDCDDQDPTVTSGTDWYLDGDGDLHGDGAVPTAVCPDAGVPEGYVQGDDDCDDANVAVNPDAVEVCNGIDDDCDGLVDDADEVQVEAEGHTWYADADEDGYGDASADAQPVLACEAPLGYTADQSDCDDSNFDVHEGSAVDEDEDGYPGCSDCNDIDPVVSPSGVEICDGVDNNCDGQADEPAAVDAGVWYADTDGDGHGDPEASERACTVPPGTVGDDTDCDDANATVFEGADELCDGVDHDCDGLAYEGDSTDAVPWFSDADSDGYGTGIATTLCVQPEGTAAYDGDCDDADTRYHPGAPEADCTDPSDYNCDGSTGYANVDGDAYAACEECDDTNAANFPGAPELCDGVDNNCDLVVDEASAIDSSTWYSDTDVDGFGDPDTSEVACDQPTGYVDGGTDCDDSDARVHPGAPESCDSLDHDCDGQVNEDDSTDAITWYADLDIDSFGSPDSSTTSCAQPAGYVATGTDCSDGDAAINPAAAEICNALDDDCDTLVDDADALDPSAGSTFYTDADGDGFGDPSTTETRCSAGTGRVTDSTDCDDEEVANFPGNDEVCDSIDNDCDSTVDEATEALNWFLDADGDGYGDALTGAAGCTAPAGYVADASDCDDAEASIHVEATDTAGDGIDQDCDGVDSGTSYTDGFGGEMIAVAAGTFTMGSGRGDAAGDYVDHDVTLSHGFWIGRTEVTQAQWSAWTDGFDTAPSYHAGCDDCPVEQISWYEAAEYANALSESEGLAPCYLSDGSDLDSAWADPYSCPGFRFPTEAEWEYAAAAGVDTKYAGSDTVGDVAWTYTNSGTESHEVCTLASNAWGLCDMSGNAYEWAHDWYDSAYSGYGDGVAGIDPAGPSTGADRVVRGGSWSNYVAQAQLGYRNAIVPDTRADNIGIRLVRTIPDTNSAPSTPTASISPSSPADSDDLVCAGYGSVDPDGDVVSYSYSWTVDGVDAGVTEDTVPAASTAAGEVWTCSVPATDGSFASVGATASVTISSESGCVDGEPFTLDGLDFVSVCPGTFQMGCTAGQNGSCSTDETEHTVTLTHAFYIAEHEVTRTEWELDSDNTSWSYFSAASCASVDVDCPADQMSWVSAALYANWLSTVAGLDACYTSDGTDMVDADPYDCTGYRLPTEAEWEFAARAGTDSEFSGGDVADDVAWTSSNSGSRTHGVCTTPDQLNLFGLCDMSGNVWEWTNDRYGILSSADATDPVGATTGSDRVVRGGRWDISSAYAAVGYRSSYLASSYTYVHGFRLVRTIPTGSAPSTPSASISPSSPADSDDLVCTGSGSVDPDGDVVSYTYSWTVDGLDAGITEDTVPAASTAAGEVWECGAVASDGAASSAAGTASVTIAADASAFVDYTTTYGSLMIAIPAGTFTMGGGLGDPSDEYLDHEVTLTHDFWIGETEITRGQLEMASAFLGWTYNSLPSYPCTTSTTTGECPADSISWYDVAIYANTLSTAEGLANCYLSDGTDLAAAYSTDPYSCPGYRMPTEAEWEYTARAGEDTRCSGSDTCEDVSWQYENAYAVSSYAHEVATLAPNAWGVYDMSGNVWEWTNEWYDSAHGGYADGSGDVDPAGPVTGSGEGAEGSSRVVRGGYWAGLASDTRVALRNSSFPSDRGSATGGRLSRSLLP